MIAHYRLPVSTPEVHAAETRAWAQDFIDEGVPAKHVMTLYRQARNAKETDFPPTLRDLLRIWAQWKKQYLPDYRPSFHVRIGELTEEEDQRRTYGYSIPELVEKILDIAPVERQLPQHKQPDQQPSAATHPCPPKVRAQLDDLSKGQSSTQLATPRRPPPPKLAERQEAFRRVTQEREACKERLRSLSPEQVEARRQELVEQGKLLIASEKTTQKEKETV